MAINTRNGLLWRCKACGWSTPRDPRTKEDSMICCRCQNPTRKMHLRGYEDCVLAERIPTGGYAISWIGQLIGVVPYKIEADLRVAEYLGEVLG